MNTLLNDTRFALRQLRKSPGFATTVILTLALGITATTVIFSLVNAVLLSPLPFPDSGRLVSLDTLGHVDRDSSSRNKDMVRNDTSYPNFFDWRALNKSFSSMASYTTNGYILAPGGGPAGDAPARRIRAVLVSSDFFATLGVAPELGRGFTRSEEQAGNRVVVLSHTTWANEFNSDLGILGKTITLSDRSYTVIGVMPQGFAFPVANDNFALWMTFADQAEGKEPSTAQRGWNQVSVVGRLKPGVSLEQAKADMDGIQQSLASRYRDEDGNETAVNVVPQLQDIVSDVKTPLRVLFSAVCCLLLIVCANVAGLLLTRSSQRRGELAIRSALGATRIQILRQLLVESTVLSLSGGLLGLAATAVILRILPSVLPANLPRLHQIALSGEVMAFAIGLSLITGLVFGVLPAWFASKQDPSKALGENSRGGIAGRRHYRLQSVLVIAQTALGLVLLVGAGLLIRSFDHTLKVDPGFTPQQVATFRIAIPGKRYDRDRRAVFFRQLLSQLGSMQGVQSATAAYPLPLTESDITITFIIAGHPTKPGEEPSARVSLVEPNFFETLRIPLKRGRLFLSTEHDPKGPPVVIVNEAFARQYFPGQEAVGQHMRSGLGDGDTPPMREIVGIVANVKRESLTEADKPEYYIPLEQANVAIPSIAMRVGGDVNSYSRIVAAEVAKIDPSLPVYRYQSYDEELSRITAQQRFQTLLLTAFAVIALLLSALGLYAVLSYMVTQRTTELGLRIALGAQRSNVLNLMLFRGLRLALIGLCVGIASAALLTRFVANLLFNTRPLDATTFTTMALVLLAVSSIASLIPAWRASLLDPNEVLRNQ